MKFQRGYIAGISSALLFGAVFAFIVLSEPFSFAQVLAGLVMMFGVFLLPLGPHEPESDSAKAT